MILLQAAAVNAASSTEYAILCAMFMPFLLLVIFSMGKYIVAVGVDKIDYYDFFAEMAIDLLSIFSSFIIGRFIIKTNTQAGLITAFNILAFMALCAIILCVVRRKVMSMRAISNVNMKNVGLVVASEYLVDVTCLILMAIFSMGLFGFCAPYLYALWFRRLLAMF